MTEGLTDTLLALVLIYGPVMIGGVTFASCLALPVPASLVMLAGGAFAATGDLSLGLVMALAFAGGVAGDQVGYLVGARAGGRYARWSIATPRRTRLTQEARQRLSDHAFVTVYLTRWLLSPLGPWVNLAAGAMRLNWARFSLASLLGEATWVGLYVGLGWAFASQVDRLGTLTGNLGGLVLALALVAGALVALRRLRKSSPERPVPVLDPDRPVP